MYIGRELEEKIRKYLRRKEIIAIVGARQCGKTTLMKHVFEDLKNAKFIGFDDQNILQTFNEDIELFIETYIKETDFLFIDEFQYAKEGGKTLKYIYDNYKTKIIISGSSAAELSIHSIKYLVGRIFVFALFPLSFKEFLSYKNAALSRFIDKKERLSKVSTDVFRKTYYEYITFGGYPEVVLAKKKDEKIEILKNIYNTFLLREVREILQISEDAKLIKLIKALALQIGGEVNYNELSILTGFKYNDLTKYINILKKTFICLESTPYFSNKRKELVKTPKFYFLDIGFRNISIENFQEIEKRTDRGMINENFVASELVKKDIKLNYWRTKAGAEVDFIIEKNGKIIPIEVKTLLKTQKYGKSFINFIKYYHPQTGIILSEEYSADAKLKNTIIKFRPIFTVSYLV